MFPHSDCKNAQHVFLSVLVFYTKTYNMIDNRGPMFCQLLLQYDRYETENMYTVNVRAGLEAEEELLSNHAHTSLNDVCLLLGHGSSLTLISLPSPPSGRG